MHTQLPLLSVMWIADALDTGPRTLITDINVSLIIYIIIHTCLEIDISLQCCTTHSVTREPAAAERSNDLMANSPGQ